MALWAQVIWAAVNMERIHQFLLSTGDVPTLKPVERAYTDTAHLQGLQPVQLGFNTNIPKCPIMSSPPKKKNLNINKQKI